MLADLYDLASIGAIPDNATDSSHPLARKATRLLEFSQADALEYIGETEAAVLTWSDTKRTVLAHIIAEMASTRLQYNAANSTDGFVVPEGLASSLPHLRHYKALDVLIGRTGRGVRPSSISVTVDRDETSTYIAPTYLADDFYAWEVIE